MHYLVTGGAGFIGSHLVDYLISAGHKVTIIDSLISGKKENINSSANFIHGNILDVKLLNLAFEGIEFCYHLAAIPSVQKLIEYCNEIYAKLFAQIQNLKPVRLRLFNVYGPRKDSTSSYSGVITTFVNKILNNGIIQIFGDGSQERDFIYIDDVVQAFIKANNLTALNDAEVFNIFTSSAISINSLIKKLFQIQDISVPVELVDPRESDIRQSIGNPSSARLDLGFNALFSVQEGLNLLLSNISK